MGQVVMVDPAWGDWAAQVVHRAAEVALPLGVAAVAGAACWVAWRVRRRRAVKPAGVVDEQLPVPAGEVDPELERWVPPWQRPEERP